MSESRDPKTPRSSEPPDAWKLPSDEPAGPWRLRASEALLRHRTLVLLAVGILTALLGAGIPRLRTDVGYRAFLGPQHPSVRTLDSFLQRFGGGLPLRAIWSCNESRGCESALDDASLAMAAAVEASLAGRPGIRRVVHPGNAPLLVPTLDGLAVRRLSEDGARVADADALAERARNDPTWVGDLISADARVGSIVIELESSSSEVASRAYSELDDALAPFASEFRFHRVGGPVEFVVAGAELDRAMARIVPIMVGLVAIGLLILLRSTAATAAALGTVGVAVIWTLGALGWIGWAKNSLTQTLPPLVLVIGVCDGIHLISRYAARCAESPPLDSSRRRATLAHAMADVARPCLLTTLTTAAGFASFATADLESFVEFGVTAAFGVCAALLLTFTLLPVTLAAIPSARIVPAPTVRSWSRRLLALTDVSRRWARTIVALALVAGALGALGFSRLRVDSSFEDLYGRDSDVVTWSRFVARNLSPPDRLEIDLGLPPDVGVGSREVREAVDQLGQRIAAASEFSAPRSFLSHPHWRQELLAAASGRATGLEPWVDLQDRHVRVSFAADKPPQDVMRRDMAQVRRALAELPPGFHGVATGPFAVVNDMIEAIRRTQLRSFAAAAASVCALLVVSLGSLRWALLAMIPTALPVVVTLGAMGLLGLPLDIGSAMVGAVVIGIAVDDTIHVLERFRSHRSAGIGSADAIGLAIREVGQPLVSTSVALAIGFSALALSPWHSVASFGLVSGVAILAALLTVLLVLPALVCSIGDLGGSKRAQPVQGDRPGAAAA